MAARRSWWAAVILVMVGGTPAGCESGQDQKPFRAETDLVMVTATVLDRDGRIIEVASQVFDI